MQVASLKINLWRFCIIVPGSQVHACRGTCIWKEQMNHHSGVHLMPQLSSCHFPVQAALRDPSERWLKTITISNSWSGCVSNICSMIQMLVVIPRIILGTNVLNYLFPGTGSGEWFGATFPNMFATWSPTDISGTQVSSALRAWLGCSTVSDGTPWDGQLSGLDSLPAPFPCFPQDAAASCYQISP